MCVVVDERNLEEDDAGPGGTGCDTIDDDV
jgi:hypothetical protein